VPKVFYRIEKAKRLEEGKSTSNEHSFNDKTQPGKKCYIKCSLPLCQDKEEKEIFSAHIKARAECSLPCKYLKIIERCSWQSLIALLNPSNKEKSMTNLHTLG
jgi:hypothetical protein